MKLKICLASLALIVAGWLLPSTATAIVFRGATSASAASGVLTLTISVPAGTLQNDVMIAGISVRPSTATITTPAGWTLIRRTDQAAGNSNALAVYSRVAGATEPASYSWTFSTSTGSAGGITSFGGVNTTTPVNVENGQVVASGTSFPTPSVTTTVANAMIVTHHEFASSMTWTSPTGMTQAFQAASITPPNAGGISIQGNSVLQAAIGATGTETATVGGNADTGATHILALTPCAAPADADYVSVTAQNGQAIVYWSSANPVVVLQKPTTAFLASELPSSGLIYTAGAAIGGATVIYDGASAAAGVTCTATSCTQTGLTNGVTYYYKVIAKTGTAGATCYAPGTVNTSGGVSAAPTLGPSPAWSYVLAGGSILKGGTAGIGTIYTSSNASRVISLSTATGTQSWTPIATTAAVQGWLTWIPVSGGAWYNAAWNYRKKITIDATKVSATLTNFPILISLTDADLQSKAQSSGNDILFTSSDGATKLSHEIEKYDGATGQLVAWVKVPSLSSTANTDIYLYYGNAAATNQQDAANVWEANYKGVWHLNQTTGGAGAIKDSTSNANHGTDSGAPTLGATGKIGNAVSFAAGGTDELDMGTGTSLNFGAGDFTVSAWIFPTDGLLDYQAIVAKALDTTPWTGWALQIPPTDNNVNMWIDQTDNAASSAVTINAWSHITWTRSGGTSRLYVSGVQTATGLSSSNVDVLARPLKMGFTGGWNDFRGSLDEVRVSSLARSAAWIQTEYNNQNSPSTFYTVAAEERGGTMVIGGDQSGRVYGVGAAAGVKNWEVVLAGADAVQAGVSVQLRANSNAAFQSTFTTDVIFAATRNASSTNNKVFALRASDGTVLWTFNPDPTPPNAVDYIVGQPWVDYTRNRIYVASRAGAAGTQPSLWVINSLNGALVASFALGHIESAPTLSSDGSTLYIGNQAGDLYAVNVATLALKWTSPAALGTAITGFVWEDATTVGRLYFATADGNVWCLQDSGAGAPPNPAAPCWKTPVAGPSTPLLLDKLYVGSSDGRLHQLRLTDGFEGAPSNNPLQVGDGTNAVGDPSTETGSEVFVGTGVSAGGKLYKFPLPLP